MTRILVTGANGHIGANVVRSLLKHGYEVVPFVRTTSDLRGLAPLNLTYAYGDVMDESSLLAATEGCDAIIHTAAVYRYWAKDPDEIMKPALVGTRNMFNAAKKTGIKRIIYTSSVWAVGLSTAPGTLLTAKDWNTDSKNPYAVAKTQSEQVAWQMSDEFGIPMIAICPNGVLGPYDFRPTPSTAFFRDLLNGTQATLNAGFAYADVRDVAEIHMLAVSGGEAGKRYIVSGENITLREVGQLVGKLTGFTSRHLGLGRTSSALLGSMLDLLSKVTKSEPLFTRNFADDVFERYMFTDCQETWDTFVYQPRSTETMVSDTIRWLLHIGEIKTNRAAQIADKFPPNPEWVMA
ncbi:MAG TPA: NAD-dependent epimerase/dehydratase family protein [Anaerolineales bacterium]|nr:NAD-dependent epimerase/dehydratase family protein [Anaerolineales bacterium]